jgi:two-component system OmpR family response regulator
MKKFSCAIVVDHDADVRKVVAAHLEAMGYSVMACSGAAEARAVIAGQSVHLLVADETMFGQGRELADHAWSRGVPTLLMSAYNESKEELTLGSRDFIGKPFRFGEFRTVVKRVLASALLPGRAFVVSAKHEEPSGSR